MKLNISIHYFKYAWPLVKKYFPSIPENYSDEDMYKALNIVNQSLIRVDADEVSVYFPLLAQHSFSILEAVLLN